MKLIPFCSGLLAGCLLLGAPAAADTVPAKIARLGWLDKTTARVGELDVPVGETTDLGVLTISVKSCLRRTPPDEPENASYMQIVERGPGAPNLIFQGWMLASSPSLSAMDHGVFDVWVLECTDKPGKPAPSTTAPASGSAPADAPVGADSVPLD